MSTLKESVESRRRVVVHLGLAAVFVASIGFVTTACIFDQGGNYQGGGHLPQGATAQSSSSGETSSSSSSGTGDDDTQSSSGTNTVLLDAGQTDAF